VSSMTLTIDRIEISPFNVRTWRPDATNTASLEASILEKGLIDPIQVHPMKGRKDVWGAIDGQRRSRALRALVKAGRLPADWPVPVKVHADKTDAELIELSLVANDERLELREHERCAAVARAARLGHSVEQIARALAMKPADVERRLRLGNLAPAVFDAFSAGRLSPDLAHAYAATDDTELQAATFARLDAGPAYAHTPQAVRAAMKVGDLELERLLRFVGADAYRAAGGRYTLDLFAEEADQRGRVVDEPLLQKLAEERFAAIRSEARAATGRPALRFVPRPPQSEWGYSDRQLQLQPRAGGKLPDGDVVGAIEIDGAGAATVTYWWASRAAKQGTAGDRRPAPPTSSTPRTVDRTAIGDAVHDRYHAAPAADAVIKEDEGLSQDAIQALRELRRAVLRAILVADADRGGAVATDWLVWSQLRLLVGRDRHAAVGMERIGTEAIGALEVARKAAALVDASGIKDPVERALAELAEQSFLAGDDLVDAFLDYRSSPARLKHLAAAIVAGLAAQRSLAAPGYVRPIHDAVAVAAGFEDPAAIRALGWDPTAELLALSPKLPRIALVAETVDEVTRRRWRGLKNDELTDCVLRVAHAAEDWMHPLLAFNPTASAGARGELQEAAE
jgi:ParB family transcriptional regulator, chromosome partitioning protein